MLTAGGSATKLKFISASVLLHPVPFRTAQVNTTKDAMLVCAYYCYLGLAVKVILKENSCVKWSFSQ